VIKHQRPLSGIQNERSFSGISLFHAVLQNKLHAVTSKRQFLFHITVNTFFLLSFPSLIFSSVRPVP
jgi:hypothetical protein